MNPSSVANFPKRIAVIIDAINRDQEDRPKRRGKYASDQGDGRKGYGEYSPGYKLNLSWLAELVADEVPGLATKDDIFLMLRSNARSLPRDASERQAFLERVEAVLNRCVRAADWDDIDFDLVAEFMAEDEIYRASLDAKGFNPEDLGFFRLSSWNPGRLMDRDKNVSMIEIVEREEMIAKHRAAAGWILDQERYDQLLREAELRSMGSPCPSLVAVKPDEREGPESDRLQLKVCESVYSKHVALRNYMRADHHAYDVIHQRITGRNYIGGLSESLADIIRVSPNSNIAINVTVQSRSGRVMLIRRPTNAQVWRSFYQVGAHETMNWVGEHNADVIEDWFQLAERALREEIGIKDAADYKNKIVFSWFGFYAPEASGYFFAHVKTRLTESELVAAVDKAPGRLEAEAIEWLDLNRSSVQQVLQCWANGPWENEARPDDNGRLWLPHATLSLTELLRVTEQKMLN